MPSRLPSEAQASQRKHWEHSGQIARTVGLLIYMLRDEGLLLPVRSALRAALTAAQAAQRAELRNNEFINPSHSRNRYVRR